MKLITLFLFLIMGFSAHAELTEPVTIGDVEEHISSNDIRTVEEFIGSLSSEMRKNFVLMHTSKSLQESSYQKPRAILYSQTAQMLLSFNGDVDQKNGNKIEMILFDKKSSKFSAHEIEFDSKETRIHKNPAKCLSCHGQDLRPNWESYPVWPGAYGSNDSRLTSRLSKKNRLLENRDFTEYFELAKFVTHYKKHPRYGQLLNMEEHFKRQKTNDHFDKNKERTLNENNADLTAKIYNLNFKRMARIFKGNKNYNQFKYQTLIAMNCSQEDFLSALPKNFKLSLKNIPGYHNTIFEDAFSVGIIRDAYLQTLLEIFGVNWEFLNPTFSFEYLDHQYNSQMPYDEMLSHLSTPGRPDNEFSHSFGMQDPELEPFVKPFKPYSGSFEFPRAELDCGGLVKKSRAALKNIAQLQTSPTIKKDQQIFQNACLKCHLNADLAGFAFHESTLKAKFKEDPKLIDTFLYRLSSDTPRDLRMPLMMEISTEERKALKTYIESLSLK